MVYCQIKTLAANVAVGQAQKKKENPYLSHRGNSIKGSEQTLSNTNLNNDSNIEIPILDDRIKVANRDIKAKRAFNFVEAGIFLYYNYFTTFLKFCIISLLQELM